MTDTERKVTNVIVSCQQCDTPVRLTVPGRAVAAIIETLCAACVAKLSRPEVESRR